MRILVIRLSSLGDVVLSTPVVRLLRRCFPAATIDVAVAKEFAPVWLHNPRVDRVIAVDRSRSAWDMAQAVRKELASYYDVVVDLQRNARSIALRWGRAGFVLRSSKHRIEKLLLVWAKRKPLVQTHVVERYIHALAPLGISNDGEGLEVWLPEERIMPIYPPLVRERPAQRTIGIAPGSRHATKQWLPERFAEVAQHFQRQGWKVVLLGSRQEHSLCATIAKQLDPKRTENAAGVSLEETIRLLDSCHVVLSNDSAAVHLAAARRVPVAVVYGSTVPEFGFTPYRVPSCIIEASIPCRPCTHIGRSRCPRGHFACMRSIESKQVAEQLQRFVAATVLSGEDQSR
ncbi:MAG: glycosyltransferase family 9 protein [Candidatus Kapabacteria bacterium]|nr:glycosyltransferase family 9 protein [Candidatus Kapabacteria bacterium]